MVLDFIIGIPVAVVVFALNLLLLPINLILQLITGVPFLF